MAGEALDLALIWEPGVMSARVGKAKSVKGLESGDADADSVTDKEVVAMHGLRTRIEDGETCEKSTKGDHRGARQKRFQYQRATVTVGGQAAPNNRQNVEVICLGRTFRHGVTGKHLCVKEERKFETSREIVDYRGEGSSRQSWRYHLKMRVRRRCMEVSEESDGTLTSLTAALRPIWLVDPLILYVAGWADKGEAEEKLSLTVSACLVEGPTGKIKFSPGEKGQVKLNHLGNLQFESVGRSMTGRDTTPACRDLSTFLPIHMPVDAHPTSHLWLTM
ncbi:hypothetical protein BC826DRAFT_1169259 [Russula brevipes]|nr:hypothetical protein BC826DRAFT_1169259 [Russula brevipes]